MCSLSGNGEYCEELRKRTINVCYLKLVRWLKKIMILWMGEGDMSCGGLEIEIEVVLGELCEKFV